MINTFNHWLEIEQMSGSDAVKKWRDNTKARMIEAFGGRCGICKYSRCQSALEFHHLDPTVKEFGIGASRARIKAWKRIVVELRKCVLLCSNCHREVHEGITDIPFDIERFNEKYADYRIATQILVEEQKLRDCKVLLTNNCAFCHKAITQKSRYCSPVCSHKDREKIDWDSYNLLDMAARMPKTEIARIIGVSDVAVYKRLKRLKNGSGSTA